MGSIGARGRRWSACSGLYSRSRRACIARAFHLKRCRWERRRPVRGRRVARRRRGLMVLDSRGSAGESSLGVRRLTAAMGAMRARNGLI